jgi:hypothetical protein
MVAVTLCAVTLFGCAASGPKLSDLQKNGDISTLQPDLGRIYFYRKDSLAGTAVRPNIKLDGNVVGESIPGGFFFVDALPGSHIVSATTEVERTVTFRLAAGETKYVKTSTSIGFLVGHVNPEVSNPAEAQSALAELSFTGPSHGPTASTPSSTLASSSATEHAATLVEPSTNTGAPVVARAEAQKSASSVVPGKFQAAADDYLAHLSCSTPSRTEIKLANPDFEIYSAPCSLLDYVLIKCDATGCHTMQ